MSDSTNGSESSRDPGERREIIPLAAASFASTAARDDGNDVPESRREIIPVAAAAFVGAFVGVLVASQLG